MADWNKPDGSSLYTAAWGEIRALATAAAKMLFTGDTNLPTGAIMHDASGDDNALKKWNGSSWDPVVVNPWGTNADAANSDVTIPAGRGLLPSRSNLTGAGTTQGAATSFGAAYQGGLFKLAPQDASNRAFKLPDARDDTFGQWLLIYNSPETSSQTALLFPASGDNINSLAANASFSIAADKLAVAYSVSSTRWAVGLLT